MTLSAEKLDELWNAASAETVALKHVSVQRSDVAALVAEIRELREALKPFAGAADSYDPDDGDDKMIAWSHDFTIGSLRRARSAIRTPVLEKKDTP